MYMVVIALVFVYIEEWRDWASQTEHGFGLTFDVVHSVVLWNALLTGRTVSTITISAGGTRRNAIHRKRSHTSLLRWGPQPYLTLT